MNNVGQVKLKRNFLNKGNIENVIVKQLTLPNESYDSKRGKRNNSIVQHDIYNSGLYVIDYIDNRFFFVNANTKKKI